MSGAILPSLPDAITDGFSGVIFTICDLTCLVSAAGLGGEGQGVGDFRWPDCGIVRMKPGMEPEETPPGDENLLIGQPGKVLEADAVDPFETPLCLGFIRGDQSSDFRIPRSALIVRGSSPLPLMPPRSWPDRFAQCRSRTMDSLMVVASVTDSPRTSPRSSSVGS